MGSRGAGSGRNGGSKATSFQDGNTTIDLSETPLVYGGTDKALTGKARESIEKFENKRYKNRVEFSTFVADDGTTIEDNRGGRGSVGASLHARQTADAMSHNHPRPEGIIGGTFSSADLNNFSKYNQHTYRATAKEGTYSISKGKNFDGKGLTAAYKRFEAETTSKLRNTNSSLNSKVRTGALSFKDAVAQNAKACNTALVSYHNWLIDNQKNYGYTYTLEKR